jgi:hypothetical protein
MQVIRFCFFTITTLIGTILAYPLVPIAVAFADNTGRLPRWAPWMETPDALGWGAGTYEPPIKKAFDKYGKRYALVRWLWRNAAYRLKFWMGMHVENYDYSQVTFSSVGAFDPPMWGVSLWSAKAIYRGRTYFDIRPSLSLGSFYIYLLIGWKLKPYISGYFPREPNAAGMFSGITPRTEKTIEFPAPGGTGQFRRNTTMWKWVVSLVDTSKLSGWVRAGVAGLVGIVSAKYFGGKLSPDLANAIGVAIAGLVVGLWSQIAKKLDPDYAPKP